MVATKVRFEVRIHKCFEFANVLFVQLSMDNSCLNREVGNATKDTMISFEYRVKPMDSLKKMNIQDLSSIKQCPIQTCIFYENIKGWKCMKVLSKNYEVTQKEEEIEQNKASHIIGSHHVQYAAGLSKKGDYKSAQMYTAMNMNLYAQDATIQNQLMPMNLTLEEQNAVPKLKGMPQMQMDSLTSKMNQAFKSAPKK